MDMDVEMSCDLSASSFSNAAPLVQSEVRQSTTQPSQRARRLTPQQKERQRAEGLARVVSNLKARLKRFASSGHVQLSRRTLAPYFAKQNQTKQL